MSRSTRRPALLLLASLLALAAAACTSTGQQPPSETSQFDSGSKRNPSAETLQAIARIMASQGKDDQCEVVLLRLVRDFPDRASAYNELSELYLRNDRVESAVAILQAGIEHCPKDVVLLNNLGMCFLVQKDYEHALAQFTGAAACDPADVRARSNMAVALGMLGRMDEALALYMQSLPPSDAHYNLGVLWQMRGDESEAAKEFELAKKL